MPEFGHRVAPRGAPVWAPRLGIVVLIVLMAGLIFGDSYFRSRTTEIHKNRAAIGKNVERIGYYDELLTDSARLAATSGDLGYERRYRDAVPRLDKVLAETEKLVGTREARTKIEQTGDANRALIALELKSFRLDRRGRSDEAFALLTGAAYSRQKEIYASSLREAFRNFRAASDARFARVESYSRIALIVGLSSGVLVLLIAIFYVGLIRRLIRQLELEVKISEDRGERYAAVLRAATEYSIIGTDREGLIDIFNHGAERMLGYEANEVIGEQIASTIHDPSEIAVRAKQLGVSPGFEVLAAAARRGKAETREWTYLRKDGGRLAVSATFTKWIEAGGKLHGFISVARDVAAERAAERLKDEFYSLVSHELRTPLTSVLGYTEMLLEERAEGREIDLDGSLRVIERNARRLNRLVGDLLFAAQVDAGQFQLELEVVDLSEMLADSIEAAEPAAEGGGIVLEGVAECSPKCAGDRDRLAQMLDNLVSNAIKYTPEGGRVEIRLFSENGEAVLEVRDTGVGIPAREQGQLFDRFFRASTAARCPAMGVGLGLTIVKAICEAHKGTISLHSNKGEGTTFRVELPLHVAHPLAHV